MKSRHNQTAVSTTLIDPLEQRLLYSADHPLGMAIALGDDNALQDDLQADHLNALMLAASIEESESNASRAIAFVETIVPDFDELSERLEAQGIIVHAINSAESGVEQVTDYLSEYSELDSIMLFSHGVESGFFLGNDVVNMDFLSTAEDEIQAWGNALSAEGDLLLFGCDVAEDETGQALLGRLAQLTQADVAASDDTTGHVDRGGNWNLEWTSGQVNTSVLETTVLDDWQGSLASILVSTPVDLVDGNIGSYDLLQADKGADGEISLREAVLVANSDASVSMIVLNSDNYLLDDGELVMSGSYGVSGVSATDTVISQQIQERVVNVAAGNIALSNLTLTGGDTIGGENGGGLFISSNATVQLESAIIRDNLAGLHGAGIYNAGSLTAKDVRLTQNTATEHGGGIYTITDTTMVLNRVTIDNNISIRDGGGLHQQGDTHSSTLDYVTIYNNEGVRGGGISAKGDLTIRNSTIVDNTAEYDGAGIRKHGLESGTVTLYNTVLVNNTQTGGSAVASEDDMFGNATSLGFNFIGKQGNIALTATDIQGTDPGLSAPVTDADGIMVTLVPTAGSALINHGGSVADQEVDATGRGIDLVPDIGAHEVEGSNGVLFWTDGISQIFRADSAGSHVQTVLTGLNAPLDLEVDAGAGRIYWLEENSEFRSALLDGSDIQTHFTSSDDAVSFALDINAGHVYTAEWNIPGQNVFSIQRYLLSNGALDRYITSAFKPTDLEFDATNNTLHWLEESIPLISESSINHFNLSTAIQTEENIDHLTEISKPSALVLNSELERLYWVDYNVPTPGRLGVQNLADLQINAVNTISSATGITFDTLNNRVVITTGDAGQILSFDSDLGSYLEIYNSTDEAGSIAYLDAQGSTPNLLTNTGDTLNEGMSATFSEATLLYEESGTDPNDVTYTITTETVEGQIRTTSGVVSTFTQADINAGAISYVNNGNHVGLETQWTDSFTFEVSDGVSTLASQQFVFTINDVDDPATSDPLQSIEVVEGGSVTISNVHLRVSDVDTPDDDVLITINSQTAGVLKYNNVGISSFNLTLLKAGGILFEHDGSDPGLAAGFDFTLSSEGITSDIIPVTISVNAVNAPLLNINDGLTLNEGESKQITISELDYTDVDTPRSAIQYTASGLPTGGKLLVDGIDQLTFTQDDVDTGKVFYRDPDTHEGFDTPWTESFEFVVSDGDSTSTTQSFTLTVNDVPDAPVLNTNDGLTLNEGESRQITINELDYTDVDTPRSAIQYTASGLPTGGKLLVDGIDQLTFTQDDVDTGKVFYRDPDTHEGFDTPWTESFEFVVSDGDSTSTPQSFTLTINDVPDAPVLNTNDGLTLNEGESKLITINELDYTDVDTPRSAIQYTASGLPTGGKLLVDGIDQLTFTQDDVDTGKVFYRDPDTHEGFDTPWTESFEFVVSDGDSTSTPQSFTLTINDVPDAPVLNTNDGLTLNEGESKLITINELDYTDVDTPRSAIQYTASGLPTGGKLLVDGIDQLTFTQDDVDTGKVFYRDPDTHEGFDTPWTESFEFVVSDGDSTSTLQSFTLTINDVPDAPVFTPSEAVPLPEGGRITLLSAHLTVTDVDTPSDMINFTVTSANAGKLLVDLVESNEFTQTDLLAGRVSFEHDGSEPSVDASIGFSVSDGSTTPVADNLVFSIIPDHDQTPMATDHVLSGNRADLMSQLQTGSSTLLEGVTDNDEPVGDLIVRLETTAANGTVSVNTDGTFSYLHDGTETFLDSFTYTITDEGGNTSAAATVSVNISGNTTPVANGGIGPGTATELQAFTLTLDANLFSDTDDDTLVWEALLQDGSALPAWLSFDSTSRTFSGTPGDADTGSVDLRLLVVDSQGSESRPLDFTLTVVDINQAPVLTLATQATVPENHPGVAVSTVTASDPDSTDTVTVTVNDERFQITGNELSLKPGLSLDHESEAQILLTITVSDEAGETVARQLPIEVQDGNDIPVLLTDVQEIALERESMTLIPADWFADEDGDSLIYTWKLASGADLPDWILFDQQGGTLSLGEIPENESTQSVVLTASDGRGGFAQLFLDLQLPPPVIAPAVPVVEPVPVESTTEVLQTTFDLDELPSNNSTAATDAPKQSLRADEAGKSKDSTAVAALGVSASGIIPLIADVDPVSAEDLSERMHSIRDTRVISDQIGDAFKSKRLEISRQSAPDVFHSTANLNDLFSSVQRQDVQTLSELAKEFQQQREEMESREKFNTAVVGSSITLSSGISVGYLIYLIRGGAIVSSMLSSLPAWRFVDPLPILSSMDGGMDTDGETLASIVSQDSGR